MSEILWSGEKSLANQLNRKKVQLIKEHRESTFIKRKEFRHGSVRADEAAENKNVVSKSPEKQDSNEIQQDLLPNNGFIGDGNDMGEGAALKFKS